MLNKSEKLITSSGANLEPDSSPYQVHVSLQKVAKKICASIEIFCATILYSVEPISQPFLSLFGANLKNSLIVFFL